MEIAGSNLQMWPITLPTEPELREFLRQTVMGTDML